MTSDMNLREKTLGVEKIFDGKVVHLERATVELPSGRTSTREVVRHVGAAAVVAVDDRGRIALVRQWRCAAGRALDEIPAGNWTISARTGWRPPAASCARRRAFRRVLPAPGGHLHQRGFSDEVIGLYLATGFRRARAAPTRTNF